MIRHYAILILCGSFFLLGACGPAPQTRVNEHVFVGGWVAADGTLFHFRSDGTFHGADWRKKEIWGNWVMLSDQRIGFQSLLHDSFYNPQYAIINPKNKGSMDYIITDGTRFITARRISPDDAQKRINEIIEPQIIKP
jgi:hypothetical protein